MLPKSAGLGLWSLALNLVSRAKLFNFSEPQVTHPCPVVTAKYKGRPLS